MVKNPEKKIITKKHLARLEKERLQRRYILIGGILVLVIVLGILAYGILQNIILVPRQPVAIVGNDRISTGDFQALVRFQRRQLVSQYLNMYQSMQSFGSDQNTQAYFQQQLSQINLQLDPQTLGQDVLNQLVEDVIISRKQHKEVSRSLMKRWIHLFRNNLGIFLVVLSLRSHRFYDSATSTLSATQLFLIPPTAIPPRPN
jgi:hypothetical protein